MRRAGNPAQGDNPARNRAVSCGVDVSALSAGAMVSANVPATRAVTTNGAEDIHSRQNICDRIIGPGMGHKIPVRDVAGRQECHHSLEMVAPEFRSIRHRGREPPTPAQYVVLFLVTSDYRSLSQFLAGVIWPRSLRLLQNPLPLNA